MKNIIRNYIENRKEKRQRKENFQMQQALLQVFSSFEQAEKSRLVFLDVLNKRVLLSDILTSPFILNEKKWGTFLQNLAHWFQFRMMQEHWDKKCRDVELEAIRKEREKHPDLSVEEISIIQTHAAMGVAYTDEDVPRLDSYEFCICDGILRSDVKAEAFGVWEDGEIRMTSPL